MNIQELIENLQGFLEQGQDPETLVMVQCFETGKWQELNYMCVYYDDKELYLHSEEQ